MKNLEELHLNYILFTENKNMKYVTQKDRKHTLLLATNVPSSKKSGWRRMPLRRTLRYAQ